MTVSMTESVSVCSGCSNKILQTRWLKQQNLLPHNSGDSKSKSKVSADLVSLEASVLGLQMAAFSWCPHRVFPLCVSVSKSLRTRTLVIPGLGSPQQPHCSLIPLSFFYFILFYFIFPLYSKGVRLSLHVYITITFFFPTLCSVATWVSRQSSQCYSAGSPCSLIPLSRPIATVMFWVLEVRASTYEFRGTQFSHNREVACLDRYGWARVRYPNRDIGWACRGLNCNLKDD